MFSQDNIKIYIFFSCLRGKISLSQQNKNSRGTLKKCQTFPNDKLCIWRSKKLGFGFIKEGKKKKKYMLTSLHSHEIR